MPDNVTRIMQIVQAMKSDEGDDGLIKERCDAILQCCTNILIGRDFRCSICPGNKLRLVESHRKKGAEG